MPACVRSGSCPSPARERSLGRSFKEMLGQCVEGGESGEVVGSAGEIGVPLPDGHGHNDCR